MLGSPHPVSEPSNNPPVSATLVCVSIDGVPGIHQHTFYGFSMPLSTSAPPSFPGSEPTSSVGISALLRAIIDAANSSESEKLPRELHTILTKYDSSLTDIRVSTTQVPCFGAEMQLPHTGFQGLGFLKTLLLSGESSSPISSIDYTSDLLEMQSWRKQLVRAGANLSHHFIVILAVDPIPLDSPAALSSAPGEFPPFSTSNGQLFHGANWRELEAILPNSHQSLTTVSNTPMLFSPESSANVAENHSLEEYWGSMYNDSATSSSSPQNRLETQYENIDSSAQAVIWPGVSETLPPSNFDYMLAASIPISGEDNDTSEVHQVPEHISCSLVVGMRVRDALAMAGIASAQLNAAQYVQSGTLWQLYRNHKAAKHVLSCMGLASESSQITYSGGLTLRGDNVLTELGWSSRSFRNKCTAYRAARELANRSWPGPVPTADLTSGQKTMDSPYTHYQNWLGIVAMFHHGYCDRSTPPQKDSFDADEARAATLSQNTLLNRLKPIRSLLDDIAKQKAN
ncbi:hypothetical protein R3P38DRAFT_3178047 [Favolaschia claudopus]|uniref:Uncharacterized protein n=1 Tax=Favolaschia claudopus TaxID=2862362 RepID=A0AAW0CWK9_9AGAR